MIERDRLMATLFHNPEREHISIHLVLGPSLNPSTETICREAANMVEQMDRSDEGDETFKEDFDPKEVEEFLAS